VCVMSFSKNVSVAQVQVYVAEAAAPHKTLLLSKPLFVYKSWLQASTPSRCEGSSQTVYKDYLLSCEAFLLP
jgi:hypothetical protein